MALVVQSRDTPAPLVHRWRLWCSPGIPPLCTCPPLPNTPPPPPPPPCSPRHAAAGTAAYVRGLLEAGGAAVQGDQAVRLSLDEAFFMTWALDMLSVWDLVEGAAVRLDTTASPTAATMQCCVLQGRPLQGG